MARLLSLGDDLTLKAFIKFAVQGNEKAKMAFHAMGTALGIAIGESD
jgi:hypothetical protein